MLPIHLVLPAVRHALADPGAGVLTAEPGAGKTTGVPLELLQEPWLAGRRIVMLEPRRLAARYAARRMAAALGEPVGRTVGYRVRFESRVSSHTRIEVITEGILTRMLVDDPALESVGLLIFDEFHERSLQADTGLALALQSREVLRPDLRLLVMSATLDTAGVTRLLGDVPAIECPGRVFSVETRYRPPSPDRRLEASVTSVVREALAGEAGDVLVFLPGMGEIVRVREALTGVDAAVLPLHGSLSPTEQDAALLPGPRRRVVLATSIAETSLTIEGVHIVIDAGLMRVPRFSPRTGMSRLETVRVSRASADQRRGRAGRLGPGVCYRIWSAGDDRGLVPFNAPEMLSSDLAPLALDLACAGVADPGELGWLDPPPAGAWAQATTLLRQLGAIDASGRVTRPGRRMATLATHPRLAHLAVMAMEAGLGAVAAELVATLGDRDVAQRIDGQIPDVDVRLRVESLRAGRGLHGLVADRGALHRVRTVAREWQKRLGAAGPQSGDVEECGRLLALAYPDRVAQRRPDQVGRFLLQNGRGASLPTDQPLARADYLVVADLDDRGAEARIALAAPIELATVEELAAAAIERRQIVSWNPKRCAVDAVDEVRLGAIVLERRPVGRPDPAAVGTALLEGLRSLGVGALPWGVSARRLRQRLAFLHRLEPGRWPDVSDSALGGRLDEWLEPHLAGARALDDIDDSTLATALAGALAWPQRAALDQMAPERYQTPAGSRLAIDYGDPAAPVLPVRLQEMFGLAETPTVGGGRVPLTLHLLSPAHRPVQVTQDLAGFWQGSYFDVRKDLRGRYPKHDWPENPLAASPVRRPTPRRR